MAVLGASNYTFVRASWKRDLEKVCIVVDRGMLSRITLEELESDQRRWDFILGVRMRAMRQVGREVLRRPGRCLEVHPARSKPTKEPAPLMVKNIELQGRRFSPLRAPVHDHATGLLPALEHRVRRRGRHPQRKSAHFKNLQQAIQDYVKNARKTPLLALDEAQFLPNNTLNELPILLNFRMDSIDPLLTILIGHAHLKEKLQRPLFRTINQRLLLRYWLPTMNEQEIASYLAYHLARVGGQPEVFTEAAVQAIYKTSRGVCRTVSYLCQDALNLGSRQQLESLTEEQIQVSSEVGEGGRACFPTTPARRFSTTCTTSCHDHPSNPNSTSSSSSELLKPTPMRLSRIGSRIPLAFQEGSHIQLRY